MSAGLLLSDFLRNPRQFPSSDDLIFLSPCGILWHIMAEHDGEIHGPQLKAESRLPSPLRAAESLYPSFRPLPVIYAWASDSQE